ncbi:MAG: hypothetical protein BGO14_01205 [Chlamydiales bacterium 38-26]|nr:ABC transporter ATP-binding protein [Chlamydiales bacterium]OJV10065.1 MAG: hypothetical protein BGO14_01205 [Chlamydiales bacterium 38-26]
MKRYLKKFLHFSPTTYWASKQLFVSAPWEASILFFFGLLQGLIPAASLYAMQGIIEWIGNSSFPLFYLSLWGSMLLLDILLNPTVSVMRLQLNEKLLAHMNLLLMQKANHIEGLQPFEDPKFYDQIQFLKNESSRKPINFVYVLTDFVKESIALLSVLIVLSSVGWWIPLAILLTSLPHAISVLRFEKESWDQILFRSPESRKMAWVSSLTLDHRVAKELRLFGFGPFLMDKYKKLASQLSEALFKQRWQQTKHSIFLSSLSVIGNIGMIGFIVIEAKNGLLSIGSFVITLQALIITQQQLAGCIANMAMFAPILLFFNKLKDFLDASHCSLALTQSQSATFNHEISFKDVSFSYADGRQALSHVSFTIRKGEKIAIVGENGAGKSTLVKLLLRFYDPTEGSIFVDGQDLKTFDLKSWRRLISGVFQDFGQYNFTVAENIALGDITSSEEKISLAAHQGGFFPVLHKLPLGLNALLGKEFGGTSLSGGEWKKLAMSRAFIREADLLILDEPTSALDPAAEQHIFKKFSEQSVGKTTLLITHRLGSVKMASRILVFKNGTLIEDGSPHDLLNTQSEYAFLFNTQAQSYR